MSRQITQAVVTASFEKADEIISNDFDYGGDYLRRKRLAIAMNLIAMAKDENAPTPESMWDKFEDDKGRSNFLKTLKQLPAKDADDAVGGIWHKMSDEHKKEHLENHPESKYHEIEKHAEDARDEHAEGELAEETKVAEETHKLDQEHSNRHKKKRKKEKEAGKELDKDDSWWNKMSLTEQRDYLKQHPKSKKARRFRVIARNISAKVRNKIHHAAREMGHDYKTGMQGLRNLRDGKKLTDEEKESLKKVAKRVAALLVGALAVTAMFSGLGGIAVDVGHKYFNGLEDRRSELAQEHKKKDEKTTVGQTDAEKKANDTDTTVGQVEVAESGVNLHGIYKGKKAEQAKQDETELDWMRNDMTEWLLKTDPLKLAEEIKQEKGM